jgi:A/G-specific adenine glycosylase
MTNVNATRIAEFQKIVWQYYDQHGRHDLPWRLPESGGGFDPYKIMVSEVMLQQTQVNRVITKYAQFLELFPTVSDLAKANLGDVLVAWQGLGYNRRAKFLWQAAQMVCNELDGEFPKDQRELTKLPGVGVNTAGAILAYTYNQPVSFIETNIRTVYIHHFFADLESGAVVHDKQVSDLVKATLPKRTDENESHIRFWYWALMDYGTFIKQTAGNKSRASKSYAKQSPFAGSKRAVRGAVIRHLTQSRQSGIVGIEILSKEISDPRLPDVLQELVGEGMVQEVSSGYRLA